MAKKKTTILDRALATINKSSETIQREVLTDRLEDFIQLCTEDISNQKVAVIPTIETKIERAKRDIVKAKKTQKDSDLGFILTDSYHAYITAINTASQKVRGAESALEVLESELLDAKATLVEMEKVLDTLQS